jgi:hypothetical protein
MTNIDETNSLNWKIYLIGLQAMVRNPAAAALSRLWLVTFALSLVAG